MNTTRKRAWQGLNAILNEGQYANLCAIVNRCAGNGGI